MIKLENIEKTYGSNTVLRSISQEFPLGKVYGIVGENGAGKTTLYRCMSGLESFDGNVTSPYKALKNVLGYLQTESHFFPRITGKEYLELYTQAREIKEVDWHSQNIFDLPLNRYVEGYSTGMKKKIALLAVLSQKNEVFILDEPFNGVDIHSNLMIIEVINRLKDEGKTVFISSHIFSTLTEVCDEIFYLNEGQFEKSYTPSEYSELELEMKRKLVSNKIEDLEL